MSERRATLVFVGLALCLLVMLGAQVDRDDGRSALGHAVRVATQPVVSVVLATVHTASDLWTGYVDLVGARSERDRVLEELRRYQAEESRRREVFLENERLRELLVLGRSSPEFETGLAARVVADLTEGRSRRAVLVDRGGRDGVGPGWVAVVRGALVGQVVESTRWNSEVLLIVDPSNGVAVRHQESRFAGILKGGNRGPAYIAQLDYVPRDSAIAVGDTIVTSGLDGIYPAGLLVGRVRALASDSPLAWNVRVEVAFDPAALEEVLLIPPSRVPSAETGS